MNFSAVRGFNAYAQFSAKIKETVASKENTTEPEALQDNGLSVYSEPVDIVTISTRARNAANALAARRERMMQAEASKNDPSKTQDVKALSIRSERTAHAELREWLRSNSSAANLISGRFSQKISGSTMNKALSGSGITVGDDEEYNVDVDMLSSVTISSKNAEKAKAIQDLLRSTPMGINWGLLLAKLPPT